MPPLTIKYFIQYPPSTELEVTVLEVPVPIRGIASAFFRYTMVQSDDGSIFTVGLQSPSKLKPGDRIWVRALYVEEKMYHAAERELIGK
jgi:hypothetical protein